MAASKNIERGYVQRLVDIGAFSTSPLWRIFEDDKLVACCVGHQFFAENIADYILGGNDEYDVKVFAPDGRLHYHHKGR